MIHSKTATRRKSTAACFGACALLSVTTLPAQVAELSIAPAAVRPGAATTFALRAGPNLPYATWIDAAPSAQPVAGEVLRLALTPAAGALLLGVTDAQGRASTRVTTPANASLVGISAYFQSFVVDAAAPNGRFRASSGESLSFHMAQRAHVERFDDPSSEGFSGEFVNTRDGRLLGLAPTTRSVVTADSSKGQTFGQPVYGDLNPSGAHQQVVIRASDLKAKGDEEIIAAIRMRPFGTFQTTRFPRFRIDLAHSTVKPDFTIDPWSSLPRFPASGLSRTYASNIKSGSGSTRVYSGRFDANPQQVTRRGYLPYPNFTSIFRYNGTDSLLIDFRNAPTATPSALGHRVYLPVPSSPRPDARVYTTAFDPFRNPARVALRGDNSLFEFEVDLVDATSIVLSSWRDAGSAQPTYRSPILAQVTPAGTSVEIEWRDAQDARGTGASAWRKDVTSLGQRYFQMRITLRGLADGTRPWLEALTLPID